MPWLFTVTRVTRNMDVWVEPERENAERLMKALQAFGFGSVGLQVDDFLEPQKTIQLGRAPHRIDVLTSLKGVVFDVCYASKIQEEVEGTLIDFIDLENLKSNKRAVGRHQDLADLENLE